MKKPIIKLTYKYYVCRCGRKIIPLTNPNKCPYCGTITKVRG